MEAMSAQGTCTACGTFTKAHGADERYATLLFNHAHGHDNGHAFQGEIVTKEANYPTFAPKGMPSRDTRRK